jgi:hypothetical protein
VSWGTFLSFLLCRRVRFLVSADSGWVDPALLSGARSHFFISDGVWSLGNPGGGDLHWTRIIGFLEPDGCFFLPFFLLCTGSTDKRS